MVVGLGPPDVDGLTLLRQERERGLTTPAIILTADSSLASTVEALDAGIADYMVEPFQIPELLARVRLRLREHEAARGPKVIEHGGIRFDIRTRHVEVDGRVHTLTDRELALLEVLLRHRGETVSREQLLQRVWGTGFEGRSNIISVYIWALRNKLGQNAIYTVRGVGYRVR